MNKNGNPNAKFSLEECIILASKIAEERETDTKEPLNKKHSLKNLPIK